MATHQERDLTFLPLFTMQNQQQPWSGSPYNYSPQGAVPLDKQATPPLQHPIPQHPITNFNPSVHQQPAASPGFAQQPPAQQPYGYAPPPPAGGQAIQYNNNMYNNFGFNDPTTQLGMQFAGNAVAQGTAYMERNV